MCGRLRADEKAVRAAVESDQRDETAVNRCKSNQNYFFAMLCFDQATSAPPRVPSPQPLRL